MARSLSPALPFTLSLCLSLSQFITRLIDCRAVARRNAAFAIAASSASAVLLQVASAALIQSCWLAGVAVLIGERAAIVTFTGICSLSVSYGVMPVLSLLSLLFSPMFFIPVRLRAGVLRRQPQCSTSSSASRFWFSLSVSLFRALQFSLSTSLHPFSLFRFSSVPLTDDLAGGDCTW